MNNLPTLRFKGFIGGWEYKRLDEVAELTSSKRIYASDYVSSGIPFYRGKEITGLKQGKVPSDILYIRKEKYEEIKSKFGVPKKGELLLTAVGTLGNSFVINNSDPFYFKDGNLIWFLNIKENPFFLDLQLSVDKGRKKLLDSAIGSTQKALTIVELNKLQFSFPSIEEQEKIVAFFSVINRKIELQSEKVEQLKNYKKGIMQQIFSQEIGFKDENGNEYPEWSQARLEDIIFSCLHEVKKPSKPYWRLGIRSHGKGTFHEYVDDPDKIGMDKLYEVKNDMLIVNITFAWEHAISVTTEKDAGKLVSHRFPTYMFKENALKNFYKYYILLPRFKKFLVDCSPGGAGRNRVLNKRAFLEIPIMIPLLEEQKIISEFLMIMDKKIEKEQEKLELLNQYKKGLLQQMFILN